MYCPNPGQESGQRGAAKVRVSNHEAKPTPVQPASPRAPGSCQPNAPPPRPTGPQPPSLHPPRRGTREFAPVVGLPAPAPRALPTPNPPIPPQGSPLRLRGGGSHAQPLQPLQPLGPPPPAPGPAPRPAPPRPLTGSRPGQHGQKDGEAQSQQVRQDPAASPQPAGQSRLPRWSGNQTQLQALHGRTGPARTPGRPSASSGFAIARRRGRGRLRPGRPAVRRVRPQRPLGDGGKRAARESPRARGTGQLLGRCSYSDRTGPLSTRAHVSGSGGNHMCDN